MHAIWEQQWVARNSKDDYVKMKVEEMIVELKLSKIGETELHAAYAAFKHGWKHNWTYLL